MVVENMDVDDGYPDDIKIIVNTDTSQYEA